MLKDAQALLAMLEVQKKAIEQEVSNRANRDDALIAMVKEDSKLFFEQMATMIENLEIAIRRIQGIPEEANHG